MASGGDPQEIEDPPASLRLSLGKFGKTLVSHSVTVVTEWEIHPISLNGKYIQTSEKLLLLVANSRGRLRGAVKQVLRVTFVCAGVTGRQCIHHGGGSNKLGFRCGRM